MIYITGDCHADFTKLSPRHFPEGDALTRGDTVLICGDFGGIWQQNTNEFYWRKFLSDRPFTVAFVDGNHENFDRLYSNEFEVVDFHGGKAHKIEENVYHLIRGYIFDFEGKSFFAFGGARSHDIQDGILDRANFQDAADYHRAIFRLRRKNALFRVNHESWWEQEMPSEEEMERGRQVLAAHGNAVDYIISHDCPRTVLDILYEGRAEADALNEYLDEIAQTVAFRRWYFGHHHADGAIGERYQLLYRSIVQID